MRRYLLKRRISVPAKEGGGAAGWRRRRSRTAPLFGTESSRWSRASRFSPSSRLLRPLCRGGRVGRPSSSNRGKLSGRVAFSSITSGEVPPSALSLSCHRSWSSLCILSYTSVERFSCNSLCILSKTSEQTRNGDDNLLLSVLSCSVSVSGALFSSLSGDSALESPVAFISVFSIFSTFSVSQ